MTLAHRVAHLVIQGVSSGTDPVADVYPTSRPETMTRRVDAIVRKALGNRQPGMFDARRSPAVVGHVPFRCQPAAAAVLRPTWALTRRFSVLDRGDSADRYRRHRAMNSGFDEKVAALSEERYLSCDLLALCELPPWATWSTCSTSTRTPGAFRLGSRDLRELFRLLRGPQAGTARRSITMTCCCTGTTSSADAEFAARRSVRGSTTCARR